MNYEMIIAVLTGLTACIPLVVKLVEYVQKATKEKNWAVLLGLVLDMMEEAEAKFEDGATRREWVIAMVQASADAINYEIDAESIGVLVDALCDMSKTVNAPKQQEA